MKIEELTFSYKDLENSLDAAKLRKLVDFKMNQLGYFRSAVLARRNKIKPSSMSERVDKNREAYDHTGYGGFIYIKEV
jgi:hypothetical protein